jgi:hypothetical protein
MLKELSTGWVSAKLNERMYRGRQITVRVAPLSAYLPPERRIALLKVDVVGAELDVFAGIDDEQWTRIDQVIVDAQDTDGRVHAIRSVLHERGFTTSLKQNATEGGQGSTSWSAERGTVRVMRFARCEVPAAARSPQSAGKEPAGGYAPWPLTHYPRQAANTLDGRLNDCCGETCQGIPAVSARSGPAGRNADAAQPEI